MGQKRGRADEKEREWWIREPSEGFVIKKPSEGFEPPTYCGKEKR